MEAMSNATNAYDDSFDLRDFAHISERCAAIVSFLANTLLASLLIREKNQDMKPYSRVLLQNCFVDVVYTAVASVVEIVGSIGWREVGYVMDI